MNDWKRSRYGLGNIEIDSKLGKGNFKKRVKPKKRLVTSRRKKKSSRKFKNILSVEYDFFDTLIPASKVKRCQFSDRVGGLKSIYGRSPLNAKEPNFFTTFSFLGNHQRLDDYSEGSFTRVRRVAKRRSKKARKKKKLRKPKEEKISKEFSSDFSDFSNFPEAVPKSRPRTRTILFNMVPKTRRKKKKTAMKVGENSFFRRVDFVPVIASTLHQAGTSTFRRRSVHCRRRKNQIEMMGVTSNIYKEKVKNDGRKFVMCGTSKPFSSPTKKNREFVIQQMKMRDLEKQIIRESEEKLKRQEARAKRNLFMCDQMEREDRNFDKLMKMKRFPRIAVPQKVVSVGMSDEVSFLKDSNWEYNQNSYRKMDIS